MVELECKQCGDNYTVRPYRKDKSRFCSKECSNEYRKNRREVECIECGEVFEKKVSDINRSENDFCSHECRGVYMRNQVTFNCEQCGEEVTRRKSSDDQTDKSLCSQECWKKYMSKPDSPDNVYYGDNWRDMRRKTLKRDGSQCVKCGKTEEEMGRQPDIHHIKPLNSFDEPEDANYLDNLVALCKKHHNEMEHKTEEVQRQLLGMQEDQT